MRRTTALGLAGLFLAITALATGCSNKPATRFASPEQAADSLVQAMRAHDNKQLARIFGPGSDDLISSGDPVSDRNGADSFVHQYDTKHSLVSEGEDKRTLVVGETDWPLPIPITRDAPTAGWYFDADAGMDELINRRVGRNELDTIQVCLAIVDAEREYALGDCDGNGVHDYAQKFVSDKNRKNGLYWETAAGEVPSPLGPLVAQATSQGYLKSSISIKPRAYHGYRFRILKAQGSHANTGARDYLVNGKMIGGFAVVAYPADYQASGIMTFIVNQDGVLYQRDLGPGTEKTASNMDTFDPGPEWAKVEPVAPASPR